MPHSHQKHLEWTPSRIIDSGKNIAPAAVELLEGIMNERPHPEQGHRACLGIIRLGKPFGRERVERAGSRASPTFPAVSPQSDHPSQTFYGELVLEAREFPPGRSQRLMEKQV